MTKYKYYLKKPRSETAKDILYWLATGSLICLAATSPYFGINLIRGVKRWKKHNKRNVISAFKRLEKRGCIDIKMVRNQIYIHLTEEGKKLDGWMQIDALKIKRPKRWDGRWRLVIFDISQLKKFYREAFRGKLKELSFYPLQKSVWIYPFDCRDEIELLRDFFGLSEKEVRLITCEGIGKDDWLKKLFSITTYQAMAE
jgi:DNA-binding transcriptional regulator PaaX